MKERITSQSDRPSDFARARARSTSFFEARPLITWSFRGGLSSAIVLTLYNNGLEQGAGGWMLTPSKRRLDESGIVLTLSRNIV